MFKLAIVLSSAALLCQAQESAPKVEFEGRYWPTDAAASAKIDAAQTNSAIDLRKDLGTNNPRVPDFRFTVRPGRNRIQFAFDRFDFAGDNTVNRTVEFDGTMYNIGTRVITSAKINHFSLSWTRPVINAAGGRFRLGPIVQGHGFQWDASLDAPSVSKHGADKRTIGFPTAGLVMEIVAHRTLSLFGEASGITAGKYGNIYNLETGARISPVKNVHFVAGFRIFDINAKFDPDWARIRITGPVVGAGVGF